MQPPWRSVLRPSMALPADDTRMTSTPRLKPIIFAIFAILPNQLRCCPFILDLCWGNISFFGSQNIS